jgi:hypothetical protein
MLGQRAVLTGNVAVECRFGISHPNSMETAHKSECEQRIACNLIAFGTDAANQ